MAEIIEMKKVNKYYGQGDTKTQVLHDVELSFSPGTFNSIIGASGSGKTTLLNMIGTLDTPSSGEVLIDGRSTSRMSRNQLAELRGEVLGFVFQFHYLLSEFTALENVLMPYQIRGSGNEKEAKERALELLELVGISNVKDNLATKMSGGQQQRTAIARALMNKPKILLADEPTGNLDSETTLNIYKLFREINSKTGTTFVVITHDRRVAEQADRIVEIKDGRIGLDLKK
jgi:lipoprotein-releasing system ATP-binding protein